MANNQKRAGRPPAVTPDMARAVEAGRAAGVRTVEGLRRYLAAAGHQPPNRRTLAAFLKRTGAYAGTPALTQPEPAKVPSVADLEAIDQLDPGSLEALQASAQAVWQGMQRYAPVVGCDPSAARAFAGLSKLHGDLVARIQEITPRESAERALVLEAGSAERAALIERARAAARADNDLRGRYERARQLLRLESDPEILGAEI